MKRFKAFTLFVLLSLYCVTAVACSNALPLASFSQSEIFLSADEEVSISDYLQVGGNTKRTVNVVSTDTDVVKIKKGKIQSVAPGKATVEARCDRNVLAYMNVIVKDVFETPSGFSVNDDHELTTTDQSLTWRVISQTFADNMLPTVATTFRVSGVIQKLSSTDGRVVLTSSLDETVRTNKFIPKNAGVYRLTVQTKGYRYFDASEESEEIVFYLGNVYVDDEAQQEDPDIAFEDASITIHFPELGTYHTGDCTYIRTNDCDILIDCGAQMSNVTTVANYLNRFVIDGTLEYVIITHAHEDHYAGFCNANYQKTIFSMFTCENVITFAGTTTERVTKTQYKQFQQNLATAAENGANVYTALQCINETDGAQKEYSIGENMSLEILNNYYYAHPHTTNENNNSVCVLVKNHEQRYMFTGDLEIDGEVKLVQNNNLPHVDLFKAGHHGSYTATSAELMAAIQPKIVCICCCVGNDEYSQWDPNKFPSQSCINNIAPYTDRIYATTLFDETAPGKHVSFNGDIMFLATDTEYCINCSNNNLILKETDWFQEHRTWPTS